MFRSVVGSRGLQLKVETAAEALAERQSPGFVDAPAEGSVDDKLHPATFIEEAFGDDRVLRRDVTQHRASLQNVLDGLLGAGIVQSTFRLQPCDGLGNRGLALRNADWRSVLQTGR